MEQAVVDMSAVLGERTSCVRLQVPRGNFQRRKALRLTIALETQPVVIALGVNTPIACGAETHRRPVRQEMKRPRRPSSRALNPEQRQAVLDAVHQMRFIDRSVPTEELERLDEHSRKLKKKRGESNSQEDDRQAQGLSSEISLIQDAA